MKFLLFIIEVGVLSAIKSTKLYFVCGNAILILIFNFYFYQEEKLERN